MGPSSLCSFILVLLVSDSRGSVPYCLENVSGFIPKEKRTKVKFGDSDFGPLTVGWFEWDSAKVYTEAILILLSEIIGVDAVPSVEEGCDNAGWTSTTGAAQMSESCHHLLVEIWWTSYAGPLQDIIDDKGDSAPIRLMPLPYSAREGAYLFEETMMLPYFAAKGKSVEFYKDFNADVNTSYFTTLGEMPCCKVVGLNDTACNDDGTCVDPNGINIFARMDSDSTKWTNQGLNARYAAATPDPDPFNTSPDGNGGLHRVWKHTYKNTWWIAPACRSAPESCLPLTTSSTGWGLEQFLQNAAWHNFPIAVGIAPVFGDYVDLPVGAGSKKIMTYWWEPDCNFILESPVKQILPAEDKLEQENGNYRSGMADVVVETWAHRDISTASPNTVAFLEKIVMFESDIMEMLMALAAHRNGALGWGRTSEWHTACEWLKENQARWETWIPDFTACSAESGSGMVSETGELVFDRADAKTCGLCPAGRFAEPLQDDRGRTSVCTECVPGKAQENGAQTECTSCEAGKFAEASGALKCFLCTPGTYQPDPGKPACSACLDGFTTTSVGSMSDADCICPAGTFRPCRDYDNNFQLRSDVCTCTASMYLEEAQIPARCITCPKAMTCEKSSDESGIPCSAEVNATGPYPIVNSVHWVSYEDPLDVYRCRSKKACEGGAPNVCGEGLKGIACGACSPGFYRSGGTCSECSDLDSSPLFLAAPLICGPFIIFGMYKFGQSNVENWGLTKEGFGGIGYLVLVYAQTINSVMGIFPSIPPTMSGGLGWTSGAADVSGFLHIECAGPQDFQGIFTFKMAMPNMAACLFFLTWLGSKMAPKIRMDGNVLLGSYGGVIKTFFITVASLSFSLFQCYEHPNGEWSMKTNPEVLRGGEIWSSMLVVAFIAIALNCVCVLAYFGYGMWVAPRHFHEIWFRRRWKFMIIKMRPSVHWWMMVIMIKGFWLAVAGVLFETLINQCLFLNTGLVLYFTGSYSFLPWRNVLVCVLDVALHAFILLLCQVMPFLATFSDEDSAKASLIFLSLSGMGFLAACASVSKIMFDATKGAKARKKAKAEKIAQRIVEILPEIKEPRTLQEALGDMPVIDSQLLRSFMHLMNSEIYANRTTLRLQWRAEGEGRRARELDKERLEVYGTQKINA